MMTTPLMPLPFDIPYQVYTINMAMFRMIFAAIWYVSICHNLGMPVTATALIVLELLILAITWKFMRGEFLDVSDDYISEDVVQEAQNLGIFTPNEIDMILHEARSGVNGDTAEVLTPSGPVPVADLEKYFTNGQ